MNEGVQLTERHLDFSFGYRYAVGEHQRESETVDEQCRICDTSEAGACDDSVLDMMKLGYGGCRMAGRSASCPALRP